MVSGPEIVDTRECVPVEALAQLPWDLFLLRILSGYRCVRPVTCLSLLRLNVEAPQTPTGR